jgi:toxin ParE1/3/4
LKRLEVVFQEAASADVLAIHRWVLEASQDAVTAARFADRLVAACERIGGVPLAGRPRDDLLPELRTTVFERRAVIAYVVRDGRVVITNVFYSGRDFEALLRGE